jgi:glycosyltransferase involved in cell wall biosynthesis
VSELLSIIVPVFNEEATVQAVIDRLLSIDLPVAREIVVVNDGSTDGTRGVLDALPAAGDTLRIVHAQVNGGKGRAIRTGFEQARGTIVAIQDADLELDPAQLAALVAPILRGDTKAVYGSRFLNGSQGAPWVTVAANRFLTGLTNVLYSARLTDMETCYKVMRTDVARGHATTGPSARYASRTTEGTHGTRYHRILRRSGAGKRRRLQEQQSR